MERPDAELEALFNKDGIFFYNEGKIDAIIADEPGDYIGASVEIGLAPSDDNEKIPVPDFTISVQSPRGVALLATDWDVIERDGVKHLRFQCWQRRPDGVPAEFAKDVAMSFTDLCFYAGNEEIPDCYGEDVLAKIRLDTQKYDLGWVMPVRFADNLIDGLGKLNELVLSGMLKESMLYGILRKEG